eukprot:snap_masked-scaffold_17-processed-gene-0.34-mRNA-1 protein AED:1.00 eAED:1.00 QI:0/0/0/0/1/1/6/0/577
MKTDSWFNTITTSEASDELKLLTVKPKQNFKQNNSEHFRCSTIVKQISERKEHLLIFFVCYFFALLLLTALFSSETNSLSNVSFSLHLNETVLLKIGKASAVNVQLELQDSDEEFYLLTTHLRRKTDENSPVLSLWSYPDSLLQIASDNQLTDTHPIILFKAESVQHYISQVTFDGINTTCSIYLSLNRLDTSSEKFLTTKQKREINLKQAQVSIIPVETYSNLSYTVSVLPIITSVLQENDIDLLLRLRNSVGEVVSSGVRSNDYFVSGKLLFTPQSSVSFLEIRSFGEYDCKFIVTLKEVLDYEVETFDQANSVNFFQNFSEINSFNTLLSVKRDLYYKFFINTEFDPLLYSLRRIEKLSDGKILNTPAFYPGISLILTDLQSGEVQYVFESSLTYKTFHSSELISFDVFGTNYTSLTFIPEEDMTLLLCISSLKPNILLDDDFPVVGSFELSVEEVDYIILGSNGDEEVTTYVDMENPYAQCMYDPFVLLHEGCESGTLVYCQLEFAPDEDRDWTIEEAETICHCTQFLCTQLRNSKAKSEVFNGLRKGSFICLIIICILALLSTFTPIRELYL